MPLGCLGTLLPSKNFLTPSSLATLGDIEDPKVMCDVSDAVTDG